MTSDKAWEKDFEVVMDAKKICEYKLWSMEADGANKAWTFKVWKIEQNSNL